MIKSIRVVFLIFLITSSLFMFGSNLVRGNSERIVVPDDYPTIQAAVNHASSGSTVFVKNGDYNETVVVNKPLSLIGEENTKTRVAHPSGASKPPTNPYWINAPNVIIQINADDVKISGFTLKNCDVGISGNGNRIQINGNIITVNRTASGEGTGIRIVGSQATVFNNKVTGGDRGILAEGSYNNITNNECIGASIGISVLLNNFSTISQNNVYDNQAFGIYSGSKSNTVIKNNVINGKMGLALMSCSAGTYSDNTITGQIERAIWIDSSNHDNVIFRNYLANNQGYAVYFSVTDFEAPTNNTFYHNTFLNNSRGVQFTRPTGLNPWDNGAEGNYWSDYKSRYSNATQQDDSGVWSIPYEIDENNRDNHPLVNPIAISGFPSNSNSPSEPFPTIWIPVAIIAVVGAVAIATVYLFSRRKK